MDEEGRRASYRSAAAACACRGRHPRYGGGGTGAAFAYAPYVRSGPQEGSRRVIGQTRVPNKISAGAIDGAESPGSHGPRASG